MDNFSTISQIDCVNKPIPNNVSLNESKTIVLQSVLNAIKAHGRSSMRKEVCGVLVGNLYWDKEAYLLIDASIEGKFADHNPGNVTFTFETWDHIHSELSEKYPDKKIVGWYHTHPGFGIFLSNMDFFIHENFFKIQWQPAYVYDPQSEADGFFCWQGETLVQTNVSVIPDEPAVEKNFNLQNNEKISVVQADDDKKKHNQRQIFHASIAISLLLLILAVGTILLNLHSQIKTVKNEIKDLREKVQQLEKEKQKQLMPFIYTNAFSFGDAASANKNLRNRKNKPLFDKLNQQQQSQQFQQQNEILQKNKNNFK